MKKRWIPFWVLFTIFVLLEASILYNSWYESHYHGYDGGHFLFFVAFGVVGTILFGIWALLNKAL